MAFRRATEQEGNAAVAETAKVIAEWLWNVYGVHINVGYDDLADILQQKLGDRIGTEEGEIG